MDSRFLTMSVHPYILYNKRWVVLFAFFCGQFCNGLNQMCLNTIAVQLVSLYDTSEFVVLSNQLIFYLSYVPANFLATYLL